MSDRAKRAFRPSAECVEERCVATAHTLAAGAELHAMAARHRADRAAMVLARLPQFQAPTAAAQGSGPAAIAERSTIEALRAPRRFPRPRPNPNPNPGSGPNGGMGLIRLGIPNGFLDYGVVSLWNNTGTTLTFGISASTYRNGQTFLFTFRPGQNQSFYAPVVHGEKPLFQVTFNTDARNPITLPQQNIVFESPRYVPQGTAGWPYAIGNGVNGFTITTI
ncbi:hypothetical protein [Singulisphaera acidiphila]|uniref:Uncharacterized protein n=1 Tax=Singulisphaera acidiphila (strain ATCC BAA-1392 / DSM 18658 / VKM B-2454 / MOB10) TaxID=886293 RepID=L0DE83_SINAD|nr:hypothetical protein [Singulisphaera acidiphila]AGA27170.1 hypothetical protein Sinac_2880 [Singulisphaera acidiphila DSM 18658]